MQDSDSVFDGNVGGGFDDIQFYFTALEIVDDTMYALSDRQIYGIDMASGDRFLLSDAQSGTVGSGTRSLGKAWLTWVAGLRQHECHPDGPGHVEREHPLAIACASGAAGHRVWPVERAVTVFDRLARWRGYAPVSSWEGSALAQTLARDGAVLGVNGGSHDAGAALVVVRDGEARLVLNAEEERWSRVKHDCGAPTHALAEALAEADRQGLSIAAACCGWDFAAFAQRWTRELRQGFPNNLGLFTAQGFIDLGVATGLPDLVRRAVGLPGPLVSVPHHHAHAWGSLLPSPFHDAGEDVLVVVIDGMGDRGSLSVFLARDGREPTLIHENRSLFDSLGLFYQVLSSTQGGWTPLASEGRFMGAAAFGETDREKNAIYQRIRPMVQLGPGGTVHLDRAWMRWDRDPKRPYGEPLRKVLGEPIPASKLWDPNAVLDPERLEVPELTRARLDAAAGIQALFEDAVEHVIRAWVEQTGAHRVIWTGGTALNAVAALRLAERLPSVQWWTPPFPGDNGVAAGAALHLAWRSGVVRHVHPLETAFLGGARLTSQEIRSALAEQSDAVSVTELAPGESADWIAERLVRGEILGLAHGCAETGPRALGHRSILADPTRADALRRINAHVKRRESVRPLAPMMLPDEAERHFVLSEGTTHHDLHAWRFMVRCARARPGTAVRLPAVVHVDGTSRIQVVDPRSDPLTAGVLRAIRERNGFAVAVNTSLNVGEPIAHRARDVLATLGRARDLHGVVLIGDDGVGYAVRPRAGTGSAWE